MTIALAAIELTGPAGDSHWRVILALARRTESRENVIVTHVTSAARAALRHENGRACLTSIDA